MNLFQMDFDGVHLMYAFLCTGFHWIALTFGILAFHMLKYPVKYVPAETAVHTSMDIPATNDDRTMLLLCKYTACE